MATSNLSDYKTEGVPNGAPFSVAIVVSEWNNDITGNLLKGAEETLLKHGVAKQNILVHWVPGSYELPLSAQFILESKKADAVICLGSVIQGQTKHFDFVCQAAADGIMNVGLKYNKPVVFGVLTDNTKQQAIDRSGGLLGNKGIECAVVCLKMLGLKAGCS